MKKELVVRLSHLAEIFEGNASLVLFIPFFDSFVKHFGTRLEVDDKVRLGYPSVQQRVDLLVEVQLLGA